MKSPGGPGRAGDRLGGRCRRLPRSVHADLRADNILLTADRVVVVDWPWACLAAPWFDLVRCCRASICKAALHPRRSSTITLSPGPQTPGAVTAVLAALTGFFVRQSRQPPPPGLPTLRVFQAAQGRTALAWLKVRTTWR